MGVIVRTPVPAAASGISASVFFRKFRRGGTSVLSRHNSTLNMLHNKCPRRQYRPTPLLSSSGKQAEWVKQKVDNHISSKLLVWLY